MTKETLGKIDVVNLREYWKDEANDFTPWLAEEGNISLLGETLGIDLEVEAKEKSVGPFKADILCRDTNDNWVLVENQLERTDHNHLGQLLTYAAGLDAVTIIWIADSFAEEHRSALDWLNRITSQDINFCGVSVELWRIGDSPPAPKFNVISKPDDWARTIQRSAASKELSDWQKIQLKFWTIFRDYMEENSFIRCGKPAPHNWTTHAVGRAGFHLQSIASFWDSEANVNKPEIRVELMITSSDADNYFTILEEQKAEIEEEIGLELKWYNPPNQKQRRIYIRRSADISDNSDWPNQHKWLKEHLELYHKAFSNRIKDL